MTRACAVVGLLLTAGCGSISEQPLITAASSQAQAAAASLPVTRSADPEHARLTAAYGGVYANTNVERSVARVVGRLVAASDDPSRSYRLTILNSPAINAFALQSGDLYVTRGLIALANDESELAAVIAHEMAHVTARHATARQRRAQAVAVANRVVGNMINDTDAAQTARETAELSLARFSQSQELEADAIGVRTLAGGGFDPFAAARFLRSMGRFAALPMNGDGAVDRPDFLSSHPATPARIDLARRAARRFSAPGIGTAESEAYLRRLDGLLFGDDPREGFVRGRDFMHAELGIAFEVPERFSLRNTSAAVLATDGRETAIRFDSVAVPASTSLADYLKSGWVNGLRAESVRTELVNGLEAASADALVEGWSFRIGVIRVGPRVYRFIFASAAPPASYDRTFNETFHSFRRLSREDRMALQPLRIRVVAAAPGDTLETLVARMQGTETIDQRALFQVLNGLEDGEPVQPGRLYKIVAE